MLPWWTLGPCLWDPSLGVWEEWLAPAPCFEKPLFPLRGFLGQLEVRQHLELLLY